MLGSYKQKLDQDPEAPRIFFSLLFDQELQEGIRAKIREIYAWNRKVLQEQFNISHAQAVILLGMLNGVLIQAMVHPETISFENLIEEMAALARRII